MEPTQIIKLLNYQIIKKNNGEILGAKNRAETIATVDTVANEVGASVTASYPRTVVVVLL